MLRLRAASLADVEWFEKWDQDPDVIAATTDDPAAEKAFSDTDWRDDLSRQSELSYHLIAELDGRPIAALQICDPALEPTHYWGDIERDLRAIDIWIGSPADRSRGYGARIMRLAHARCFRDEAVTAIVIDPLFSNTRARAFYARLGYEDVGRRSFGDDDCLVMRLTRTTWSSRYPDYATKDDDD